MRRAVDALLRKELRLELRAPQAVPAMALFSVTTLVVFHFALQRGQVEGDLAAGVLWVTLLFAAMLGTSRLFVADHEEGGLDGFLLAPVDRTALLVAKAVAMFAFLAAVEIVAVPAFALLLLEPAPDAGTYAQLVLVLALADAGVAIIGTLVGALAVQTRARDLLVPLLALPLLIPVVIGAAKATTPLLLAPVDRTALLVAKAVAMFAFLAAVEIVAVPAFALLLLEPAPDAGTYAQLVLVLALADAGVAIIGTLVGALAVQTRARDLLVPLLALPLLIPVVIGAAKATTPLLLAAGAEAVPLRWLAILGLYDLVFGLLAYAVFDFLVED